MQKSKAVIVSGYFNPLHKCQIDTFKIITRQTSFYYRKSKSSR